MQIEVEFNVQALLTIKENFYAVANQALRITADKIAEDAKANIDPSKSGLHNRSGALAGSIKVTRYVQLEPGSMGEISVTAGDETRVPYANIHESGGTIQARNKPLLKFQVNGQWVSKKQVVIPARPFLVPALETGAENYSAVFLDEFERIFSEV